METENGQETIPAWFQQHPLLESFKKEKQAETLQRRQAAAQRLEAVNAEIAAGHPEQEASLSSILEDLKQAEKHVADLRAEAAEAGRTLRLLKADSERRRAAVEVELYSTYDQRIDEAQSFFRDRLDDLRKPGVIDSRPMGAERNLVTMRKETRTECNRDAVLEAMGYCMNAVTRLESLKLCPEYPAQEVEKLKEEIPAIDRYVEYCAERPLPKDGPISAAAPTDYEIQKLLARRV